MADVSLFGHGGEIIIPPKEYVIAEKKVLERGLKKICDEVRAKRKFSSMLSFPDGIADAVKAIPSAGGSKGIIEGYEYAAGTFIWQAYPETPEIRHAEIQTKSSGILLLFSREAEADSTAALKTVLAVADLNREFPVQDIQYPDDVQGGALEASFRWNKKPALEVSDMIVIDDYFATASSFRIYSGYRYSISLGKAYTWVRIGDVKVE